jgi:hypothetical protein
MGSSIHNGILPGHDPEPDDETVIQRFVDLLDTLNAEWMANAFNEGIAAFNAQRDRYQPGTIKLTTTNSALLQRMEYACQLGTLLEILGGYWTVTAITRSQNPTGYQGMFGMLPEEAVANIELREVLGTVGAWVPPVLREPAKLVEEPKKQQRRFRQIDMSGGKKK